MEQFNINHEAANLYCEVEADDRWEVLAEMLVEQGHEVNPANFKRAEGMMAHYLQVNGFCAK